MLLLFLGIALIVLAIGLILEIKAFKKNKCDFGDEYPQILVPSCAVIIVVLIAMVAISSNVISSRYIPEKIEMYEEENAAIEEQIADVVNDYMEYEEGIFEDISPDEAMTVVLLYPDLKANTVVEKQMEVYIANNQKIKELKEEYISANSFKWWLYFGG